MGSTININHQRRMFIPLWMTLLLTVRGNDANKGQTREITHEAGLSAVIFCYFTNESGFNMKTAAWYKCEQNCNDSDIILSLSNSSSKTGSGLNGRVSLLQPDLQQKNYSINIKNLTKSDSGSYQLRASNGMNMGTICKANITVTDVKKLENTGKTTVKKGETLNLICLVYNFPSSVLTCTKLGSNTTLSDGNATLVISLLKLNNSGRYICTPTHLTHTLLKKVNVTVTSSSEIVNASGCTNHQKVLICTCTSRGDSLSSNNRDGNVTETPETKTENQESEDLFKKWLGILTKLEVIIAFVSGVLLSACCCCTCCLVRKCCRKKHKTREDMAVTLEMVTSQEDPLMDGGQAVENNLDINEDTLQGGEGPAEEKPDGDYSALDFSRIKRKNPAEAETTQDTTETEYAEIKKGRAGAGQEEEEIGEEEVTGEDEETNCVECEDAAAQSNMEGITAQSGDDVSEMTEDELTSAISENMILKA